MTIITGLYMELLSTTHMLRGKRWLFFLVILPVRLNRFYRFPPLFDLSARYAIYLGTKANTISMPVLKPILPSASKNAHISSTGTAS